MLFILRQLRRSFFQPGKLKTYIAYAVGEILLIVIGILIAVQIGDWKEARKLDRQRLELIENLKADFKTNLERLDGTLAVVDSSMEDLGLFLDVAAADSSYLSLEALQDLASKTWTPITSRPAMGTYNSATDDGSISLLQDGTLMELFIDFEKHVSYYVINQDLQQDANITGEVMNIRRRLGTMAVLRGDHPILKTPESYRLNDEEFPALIAEKDVYAYFRTVYALQGNQRNRLQDAKGKTVKILNLLNEL